MKDLLADVIVGIVIVTGALTGFVVLLICQPLFWFALIVLILAAKL